MKYGGSMVNVLRLNLALDQLKSSQPRTGLGALAFDFT